MSRPLLFGLAALVLCGVLGCSQPVNVPNPPDPTVPNAPPSEDDERRSRDTSTEPAAAEPPATPENTPPVNPAPENPPPANPAPANPTSETPPPQTPATPTPNSQSSATPAPAAGEQTGDPDAILHRVADFYKQTRSLQVDSLQTMQVTAQGIKQELETRRSITVERPNRIAVRTSTNVMGIDLVCDGKELFTAIPALKRYSVGPAPQGLDELASNPLLGGGSTGMQASIAMQLLVDDPYAQVMKRVQKTELVGTETLDGNVRATHLKFVQDDSDWDLWTAAEGDPVVLKVSADMSKTLAKTAEQLGDKFKNMQMVVTEVFQNWKLNAPLDANAFVFTPAEGMQKTDDLLGGLGGGAQEPSPLLGKPAPAIKLALLDGGDFELAEHADKSIVMVDFWATWCGPCVAELPILVKVADEYRDKGVVFCALNQDEDADTIRKFLEEQKLTFPIGLDADSTVGKDYGVPGIPMLVLIDKKGVVQSVHLGYNDGIEQALHQELDDLLSGKNLAEETLAKAAKESPAEPIEPTGLEEVWSADGRYSSVVSDPKTGDIFAASQRGQGVRFDEHGEAKKAFNTPQRANALRPARLRPGSDTQLLGFSSPAGESVVAMDADGKKMWQETSGDGVDDVWAADLDNDGQDEVIVGYNGSTGLHVFAADGAKRWESTTIGNVWHVSAGDVVGDAAVEVVTTSAAGQVHLFDGDGKHLSDLRTPMYANMVRVGKFAADRPHASIIVAGAGDKVEQVAALDGEGTVLWTCDMPDSANHCDSMSIAPSGAWAAVGLRGGNVMVLETTGGKVVAQVAGLGERPDVAWRAADGEPSPLLLVASGKHLKAFRFTTKSE
ncbi:MAG: DUF2092 domain-containing protein [Planctomycetaceae bacterium]